MANEIIRVDARQIIKGEDVECLTYDNRQVMLNINLVHKLVPGAAKGTPFEIAGFIAFCIANQLDPLRRQVHFIKYSENEPAAWPVSYMVYHDRAQRHPGYNGFESGIVWGVESEIIRGNVCDYAPSNDTAKIIGGWCKVYRKDRDRPVVVEVPWDEAVQMKYDKRSGERVPNTNWQNKPTTMMTKVAESRALRKAFPEALGNTFSDAEPYMASPELTSEATELPKRGEEPVDVEPEPLSPLHRVAAAVREFVPTGDPKLIGEIMGKTAARAMEQPAEDFEPPEAWTDEVADKVIEMLQKFGIEESWLPPGDELDVTGDGQ